VENSAPIVPEAPISLWLPGVGVADLRVRRVARAVKAYDATLDLQRHEITGDWVVTKGESGHPIFGFGQELPRADEVEKILGKHDISRHGKRILDQLEKEADERRKRDEYEADQYNEVVAERMLHEYDKVGDRRRISVYVPKGV
jgi:hypothetical protein